MKNKALKTIGNILSVLGLVFIVYKMVTLDVDYSVLVELKVLLVVLACGVLMGAPVFINAVSYRNFLRLVGGKDIPYSQIQDLYATANIAKYLPGNVMHYANRNIIGTRYGISNKKILAATVLEIGMKIVTAAILIMLMAYDYLRSAIAEGYNQYLVWVVATIGILMVGLLVFIYYKFKTEVDSKRFLLDVSAVFLQNAVIYFINILCFGLIASVIVSDFSLVWHNFFIISGIHLTAWLVGYLTPGAPGGIGVKEAVMVFLMGSLMGKSDILLVAVLLRLASILGDVLAFGLNKLFWVPQTKNESKNT
jgi:glycosyltransferase 2 family protein